MMVFFLNIPLLVEYRVFNRRTLIVDEIIYINFDEIKILQSRKVDKNDVTGSLENEMKEMSLDDTPSQVQEENEQK